MQSVEKKWHYFYPYYERVSKGEDGNLKVEKINKVIFLPKWERQNVPEAYCPTFHGEDWIWTNMLNLIGD